jgi:isopenicillin N synthase-like dioxygenase
MAALAARLLEHMAEALGLPSLHFAPLIDRHVSALRLLDYPELDLPPLPGQLRAGAHTDYGTLTILKSEDVPGGLQVKLRNGGWVDVHPPADGFVCNIGDLMMRWTNDRWLSSLHRVVNPPAGDGRARLSIAFFNHPNYDVTIECLASQGAARHTAVRSGDYRDLKYAKTGFTAARR